MTSTKKYILIRPDNEQDVNDFVTITKTPAGAKFREALTRLSKKYNFSERDYKKGRLSFTIDFATLKEIQDQQEKKNSEGI